MTPPLGKIIFTRNLTSEKNNKIIIGICVKRFDLAVH